MAPTPKTCDFFEALAYSQQQVPGVYGSDKTVTHYKCYAKYIATWLHAIDRVYDAKDPLHMFSAPWKGKLYNTTLILQNGDPDSTAIAAFCDWLRDTAKANGYQMEIGDRKRVFNKKAVLELNKTIHGEVESQRWARQVRTQYSKKWLQEGPAKNLMAVMDQLELDKPRTDEDGGVKALKSTGYTISKQIDAQVELKICTDLLAAKNSAAALNKLAGMRMAVQGSVRFQSYTLMCLGSISVHKYELTGFPTIFGAEFVLRPEVTKGQSTAHHIGQLLHASPELCSNGHIGHALAHRALDKSKRVPDPALGEQDLFPLLENGERRTVDSDGIPNGLSYSLVSDCVRDVLEVCGVHRDKSSSLTHVFRHLNQNKAAVHGEESGTISRAVNGFSGDKGANISDRFYIAVPEPSLQCIHSGVGDLAAYCELPQVKIMADSNGTILKELCDLAVWWLADMESKPYGERAHQARNYFAMIRYLTICFLVRSAARPRAYDATQGKWVIAFDAQPLFQKYGAIQTFSDFAFLWATPQWAELVKRMQVLENREQPLDPLRDSALVFSSTDADTYVAKLMASLKDQPLTQELVERNAKALLQPYLAQEVIKPMQVEEKSDDGQEVKKLSTIEPTIEAILDYCATIERRDHETPGWRKLSDKKRSDANRSRVAQLMGIRKGARGRSHDELNKMIKEKGVTRFADAMKAAA
tara:strand:+ start:794 stop:2890 length:2097 start_codon:yes stop_codon:yes gene_type:complete